MEGILGIACLIAAIYTLIIIDPKMGTHTRRRALDTRRPRATHDRSPQLAPHHLPTHPLKQPARLLIWKPCKRCGRTDIVDTKCSHCGGHGMLAFADSVSDCPNCGCSGEEWPPRCRCGAYRASLALWIDTP